MQTELQQSDLCQHYLPIQITPKSYDKLYSSFGLLFEPTRILALKAQIKQTSAKFLIELFHVENSKTRKQTVRWLIMSQAVSFGATVSANSTIIVFDT